MTWKNYHKIVCKKCGETKKSKYKDLCNNCYKIEYPEINKSLNLGRIDCPNCKLRGRISVSISLNLVNRNIYFHSLRIQHWKYENKKKRYSHMCSVDRNLQLEILEENKKDFFVKVNNFLNQSPTYQTKSSNEDFPNGEHNISLKDNSNELSQISSKDETSLNNNYIQSPSATLN